MDAQHAPTRCLPNRPERGFAQRPHPSSVFLERQKNEKPALAALHQILISDPHLKSCSQTGSFLASRNGPILASAEARYQPQLMAFAKATVEARIARDPKYRNALLREGVELARERPGRKRAITVPANAWLDRVVRQSSAFEAKVAEELAAINIVQELVVLREARGLSQVQLAGRIGVTRSAIAQLESAQPGNIELRTLVRVAAALGAHLDVSVRPSERTGRKARSRR